MKIFRLKRYDGFSFFISGKKELQRFFVNVAVANRLAFDRSFFVESFEFSNKQFPFYSHSRQVELVQFFGDERRFVKTTETVYVNGIFQVRDSKGFVVDYEELYNITKNKIPKRRKRKKAIRADRSTASHRRSIKNKNRACRSESKREHGDFITSMENGVKIRKKHFNKVSLVKRYHMEDFTWKRKEERCWKSQRKGKQWGSNV